MGKIEEVFTHVSNLQDQYYLKSKLPDVSIRIFLNSPNYAQLIIDCCELLENRMNATYDDFDKPLVAMSAANCGVGFNIIIVKNKETGDNIKMINPKIVQGFDVCITKTNCRSIRLPEKVRIKRYKRVIVSYYDITGTLQREEYNGSTAFMIQHEVDHNNGILITDKIIDNG